MGRLRREAEQTRLLPNTDGRAEVQSVGQWPHSDTVELEPTVTDPSPISFYSTMLPSEGSRTYLLYLLRARNRFQIVRLHGHTSAAPSAKLLSKFPLLLFTNLPLSLFLKLTFLSSCYSGILPPAPPPPQKWAASLR